MVDDVVFNKIEIIERCLKRINEEYNGDAINLRDLTKQDSIILNIQRACEASIDLAMHVVAMKGLGIPQSSRDAFDILVSNSILEAQLARQLKAMVGFRNILTSYKNNSKTKPLRINLGGFILVTSFSLFSYYDISMNCIIF